MRGWLVPLVVVSAVCIAAAEEAPVDAAPATVRGRPDNAVKPAYPSDALDRGQTGVVIVEGVYGPDGQFSELNYTPDRPESAIFVEAVSKVTQRWEFSNARGKDCSPVSIAFRSEVAFNIENGQPRVSVTHAGPAPAARASPAGSRTAQSAHFTPIHRAKPEYPYTMLKRSFTGKTYALIVVNREGSVESFKTHTRSVKAGDKTEPFDAAAARAIRTWKYPPVPPDEKAPWVGCTEITWRLRD